MLAVFMGPMGCLPVDTGGVNLVLAITVGVGLAREGYVTTSPRDRSGDILSPVAWI